MKTIELVGYGHPDRFADYISEKILTETLKQDKNAHVASEVMVTKDTVFLGGEITSTAILDYQKIVYDAIERVYGEKWWPNFKSVKIINDINNQSKELEHIQDKEIVAGDQGVIYGYYYQKRYQTILKLYRIISKLSNKFDISPDWKLLFSDIKRELSISVCGIKKEKFLEIKHFLEQTILKYFNKNFTIVLNPRGEWMVGGPLSDTGLTGRKLMIDTFGAGIPHGGGAFCGKDFSKVDKTGIIIASEIAHNYAIKHKIDNEIFVELSYKIGDSKPLVYIYDHCNKLLAQEKQDKTLYQWIQHSNLYQTDWSEVVLEGGIISYLSKLFLKK